MSAPASEVMRQSPNPESDEGGRVFATFNHIATCSNFPSYSLRLLERGVSSYKTTQNPANPARAPEPNHASPSFIPGVLCCAAYQTVLP